MVEMKRKSLFQRFVEQRRLVPVDYGSMAVETATAIGLVREDRHRGPVRDPSRI